VITDLLDDRLDRYLCMGWSDRRLEPKRRALREGLAVVLGLLPGEQRTNGEVERGCACDQLAGSGRNPRRAAIVTRSGSESAFILRIT
jgi:hypothetical protein